MRKEKNIVINTGPILAIVAALHGLDVLDFLYKQVTVPFEVCQEILSGGSEDFGIKEFHEATFLHKMSDNTNIYPFLRNSLDLGEASVIQTAIDRGMETVCIDERHGRRIARLNMLKVTGSIGILLRAKKEGYPICMDEAIRRMQRKGIRLGKDVIDFALGGTK